MYGEPVFIPQNNNNNEPAGEEYNMMNPQDYPLQPQDTAVERDLGTSQTYPPANNNYQQAAAQQYPQLWLKNR